MSNKYGNRKITFMLETIFAALVIGGISENRFYNFLDIKIFKILGTLSFSFYLYHLLAAHTSLLLYSLKGIDLSKINQLASTFVYIATSVPIAVIYAWISYQLIEKPSIEAGANISKRIKFLKQN